MDRIFIHVVLRIFSCPAVVDEEPQKSLLLRSVYAVQVLLRRLVLRDLSCSGEFLGRYVRILSNGLLSESETFEINFPGSWEHFRCRNFATERNMACLVSESVFKKNNKTFNCTDQINTDGIAGIAEPISR